MELNDLLENYGQDLMKKEGNLLDVTSINGKIYAVCANLNPGRASGVGYNNDIAKKYDNTGVGVEDLISIGTIGLIKAISTYRLDKKIKLATYASRCIENEILMYIRKTANQKTEVSLDEPINMDCDGNELLLSDILGTDEDMIMRPLEDDVDICVLRQALRDLPDREREIVLMRFGLEGRRELTQKEVAQKMGISQSYISRLEKRIMLRLKKEFLRQTSCA